MAKGILSLVGLLDLESIAKAAAENQLGSVGTANVGLLVVVLAMVVGFILLLPCWGCCYAVRASMDKHTVASPAHARRQGIAWTILSVISLVFIFAGMRVTLTCSPVHLPLA